MLSGGSHVMKKAVRLANADGIDSEQQKQIENQACSFSVDEFSSLKAPVPRNKKRAERISSLTSVLTQTLSSSNIVADSCGDVSNKENIQANVTPILENSQFSSAPNQHSVTTQESDFSTSWMLPLTREKVYTELPTPRGMTFMSRSINDSEEAAEIVLSNKLAPQTQASGARSSADLLSPLSTNCDYDSRVDGLTMLATLSSPSHPERFSNLNDPIARSKWSNSTSNDKPKYAATKKWRRWTKEEDAILLKTVSNSNIHRNFKWSNIANLAFKGLKTGTQCRNRWRRVLNPQLHRGKFTQEEDDYILDCVTSQGTNRNNWAQIAASMPHGMRDVDSIRHRYQSVLDPKLKKSSWTDYEIDTLKKAQKLHGNRWTEICKLLPGRSANNCKLKYYNNFAKASFSCPVKKTTSNEKSQHFHQI